MASRPRCEEKQLRGPHDLRPFVALKVPTLPGNRSKHTIVQPLAVTIYVARENLQKGLFRVFHNIRNLRIQIL